MEKKPKRERDEGLDSQYADDMLSMDIISANEVTGMVSHPPMNEAEVEGYLNLFPVTQQKDMPAQKADTPTEQEKHNQMDSSQDKKA